MQKIIIKNFGAVKYAEIEIKKVLVLIGEQASGKSTIAKLIYFFKSLRDEVFKSIYQDKYGSNFAEHNNVVIPLTEKFHDFFGSPHHLTDFDITFYYDVNSDKYLNLKTNLGIDNNRILISKFSEGFFSDELINTTGIIKQFFQKKLHINNSDEQVIYNQNKDEHTDRLRFELNALFNYHQDDSLFIVAGRNITVRYSGFFEQHFFANVEKILDKNTNKEFQLKEQSIDEILILKFLERILFIKDILFMYGGFKGLISRHQSSEEDSSSHERTIYLAQKKFAEVLKGDYIVNDNHEEKIMLNSQESIFLRDTSSGQQEAVRILQDIFFIIIKQAKVLRIVEEPEAHLFPVAQKNLVELLALMVNQNDENQLIITTHSPYVLTVFNNLLFAQRVVDKNPSVEDEVSKVIPKEFWLAAKDFSAYSLGNHYMDEKSEYCESIFNTDKGTIKQNYLDTVSEMLGGDFNFLYSIHAKTFGRR